MCGTLLRRVFPEQAFPKKKGNNVASPPLKKVVNIVTDTTILELIQCKKGQKRQQFCGLFKWP